ncbi:TetR/AcrR family transcriptional regulator [Nonomuraea typhae]|uniref:TetR/AcrR family transcriptional regulator n=1 Tax=Nonomuraea typhae TaxID=2603600 RepID=UPI0012FB7597|nr:TetR/AcrR family transcriptional regulator [Nonomuraea typhae]
MANAQQYPSVWTRPQPRRREHPALSREQIVAEALKLLDADGIDALSMRRLGAALNAGATSLYTHVANKDELIELVVDLVLGEIELPAQDDWRPAMETVARRLRAIILGHPWIAAVLDGVGTTFFGPNMMRITERLLGVQVMAGFTTQDADETLKLVFAYVIGLSAGEAAALTRLRRDGWTEQDVLDSRLPDAETIAEEGFPLLSSVYLGYQGRPPEEMREASFEYGLARILEGVTAHHERTHHERTR